MTPPAWVTIGIVAAPHGVRGEVRVKIETDFPERFTEAQRLRFLMPPRPTSTAAPSGASAPRAQRGAPPLPPRDISPDGERAPQAPVEIEVESAREHRGMMLLKLAGHDDREAAERLRGARVVIPRDEVRPLPDGTWYVFDLEGLDVYTRQGAFLGVLTEVLHPGGNDVYVVKDASRETLVPAIKQVIVEVDLARRRMTVDPLEDFEETR